MTYHLPADRRDWRDAFTLLDEIANEARCGIVGMRVNSLSTQDLELVDGLATGFLREDAALRISGYRTDMGDAIDGYVTGDPYH